MGSTSNAAGSAWATEPIAIVGMSTKFAGDATNTENFWRMIEEAKSGWTPFPASRFRPEGVYHPNNERLNSTHVKGAHLLAEDVALFDAAFFSYSSETASSLDPQYRLQLESVYEALENAGLPLAQLAGSNTSVFTGVFVHDYRDGLLRDPDNLPRLMATGTGVPMMSNRISHFFDFRGASMTIETACSSGMVAMHQAVQSLRTGEADMSVVGGANLTLNPDMFKALGSAGFLSADGRCYAFDHRASGYGRGEGVATLVIKRLSDALAAGDPIRAIVRESMINQDGKTETITTPSLEAQKALVRGCYRKAGLDPRDTQYFEAHGTGTQAGDTVEARAIADVFASRQEPLLIGSVKTNIGHTEAASGLGSIIKVALALDRGVIPPTINFEKPNPKLHLDDWNLRLVRHLEAWPEAPVRRASINNFGYGGTNAHVILESTVPWVPSAAPSASAPISPPSKVLVLSAKDEQACQSMITNLASFLSSQTAPSPASILDSVAYTLGERRTRFPWVAACPVPTNSDLESVISIVQSPRFRPSRSSRRPRLGFVFTGQGAQWHAMGRELVGAYPAYRAALEEAEGHLRSFGADWSLIEELSRTAETTRVNEVRLSTPVTVAVQIALVRLLREWKVEATGVVSHSSGEIAAAYSVGAMSLRTAMAFAYYRAELAADPAMRGPVKGGMIAVGLGLEETERYLGKLKAEGRAVVACVNSPSSITVAGDLPPVVELEELCGADGVFARRLKVDVAWHSHHMARLADAYVETLRKVDISNDDGGKVGAGIAFSSPVSGGRMDDHEEIAAPQHWVQSLVQPVQFVSAFTDMVLGGPRTSATNIDVVIEIGPHTALGGPIQQILALPEFNDVQIPYYGCLVRKTDARESMQLLASKLLQEGYPVDMSAVNFPHGRDASVKVLTSLPSYPWNHQVRHWVEPRANRALRERSQPPHDLLGSLVEGSNPDAPSWRHHLRISDSPWTRDHAIQGNVVFPAAGYMSLAIEALKQLTALAPNNSSPGKATGYRLRDVDFLQALMIPDSSEGIEIQTSLRPVSSKNLATQGWRQFEVWSVSIDNRWTQHAQGLVSLETSTPSSPLVPSRKTLGGYTRRVVPSDLFSNLRALGIAHGPVFQNMRAIVQAGAESRSEVTICVPDTSVPKDLPRSPVVHPVTLDAIITAPYSAVPGAGARETAAKVPRAVGEFWVSAEISHDAGHLFVADSAINRDESAGMEADVAVRDEGSGELVLEMKGFAYQSLGQVLSLQTTERYERELVSRIDWGMDVSIASSATVAKLENELGQKIGTDERDFEKDLWRVCVHYFQQALAELQSRDTEQMEPHEVKYLAWMKEIVQRAASGELCEGSAEWLADKEPQRKSLVEKVSGLRVDGEMIRRVGAELVPILRGQTAPLELMIQEGLLSKYNSETPRANRKGSQIAGLVRHLTHKSPRARILEIGSGTGSISHHALRAIGSTETGGPNASLYHFTDVAAIFFEVAKEQLSAWGDLVSYDVLDIERDPATQGFEAGSYDIVIASGTLSGTKSISRTLGHVRSLIKPGGSLLLTEDLQPQLDTQLIKGLFQQWWQSEEPERATNPLLTASTWRHQLQLTGFSSPALELYDDSTAEASSSVTLMSTLPKKPSPKLRTTLENVAIVTNSKACPSPAWLNSLQTSISALVEGSESLPSIYDLESQPSAFADKFCIFVGEVDEPILHELDSSSLEGIRAMSTSCRGLLWVTRGGAVDCERPELSLATGFVRTLRNEYVGRSLLTLDLDPSGEIWSEAGPEAIVQVLRAAFGEDDGEKGFAELEFAERQGVILVPRLNHDIAWDQKLSPAKVTDAADSGLVEEFLFQADRPLCLQAESTAFGDDVAAQTYRESLSPALIEVEPRAYGAEVNGNGERIIGRECAGVVTRAGREAAAKGYSVGDRVLCVLQQSSFPSRAIVQWSLATHIPDDLSFEQASSLPVAFLTAYFSLVETARLRRSQSVLIHAAAGSIGQAAIMVAQHLGADIFATVDGQEERESILKTYGIPADRIFDKASFGAAVLKATKSRGVDVVLNSLAGPLLQESFNLVAPLGYFIETGKRDLDSNGNLEMRPFARGVTFSAVDLSALLEHRASDVHRCLGEVMRLIRAKVAGPVQPINTFALGQISEASRKLQTGDAAGKVVLSVRPDEKVPVLPRVQVAALNPEASYLIVGGNGGLGQSVAHWLVSRGARNLVLLSRSAGKSEKMAALAAELREAGCTRVLPVSCDVADADSLASALDMVADEGLPPVRGIIHAAFVLYDNFVEKMTLEDWTRTTSSKVAGAWNLHAEFPLASDLDFFVLFSSINGVLGYASQAAYAAAGAYEDALAHWRTKSMGLPAVALDLSVVNSVGYVAEAAGAETLTKALIRAGRRAIDESHVLAALETAILRPFDPQYVIGGVNSGPGPHWDADGDLGRDARAGPLSFRPRRKAAADGEDGLGGRDDSLAARMAACGSREEAVKVVGHAMAEILADMFLVPVEDIDLSESPSQQGIDSLMAVEVRNLLFKQAAAELSIFNIMQSPSLNLLAADVVDRSSHFVAAA